MSEDKRYVSVETVCKEIDKFADFLFENDYVQVVRCRHCLHFKPTPYGDGGTCIKDNRQWAVRDYFFCFNGEEDDGWDYEKGNG